VSSKRFPLRLAVPAGACLLAVAALAAPVAVAQTAPVVPTPSAQQTGISVSGQGIVMAQPNVARITVGVEVTDAALANAQAEAARRMDAVVQKLKADGIQESDIRTTSYTVNPQYDQNQTLRGFQVQNLVSVKSTNVAGLGQLMDDAVAAGASRIYDISFEADNMPELMSQARDQAMQDAQTKAQQLAKGSGVGLGRPILVEDVQVGGVTPVAARQAAPAPAAMAAQPTPVQPGELQVTSIIHVVWAIQ
jgi:uncharacterized protein